MQSRFLKIILLLSFVFVGLVDLSYAKNNNLNIEVMNNSENEMVITSTKKIIFVPRLKEGHNANG